MVQGWSDGDNRLVKRKFPDTARRLSVALSVGDCLLREGRAVLRRLDASFGITHTDLTDTDTDLNLTQARECCARGLNV